MKNDPSHVPGIMSPIPLREISQVEQLQPLVAKAWELFMTSGSQVNWRNYLRLNRALEQMEKELKDEALQSP